MDTKKVKDLMVPLGEYAIVSHTATILDALEALERSQTRLPPGKHRHRAVLVIDDDKKVVGKIGHLGFLRALEPKYSILGDMGKLSRVGLEPQFISSMMDNFRFFEENLSDLCHRACHIRVVDVMRPVEENIDENATINEAIHKLVMWQTLSLLVIREKNGKEVVGLLRLSDVFEEITNFMKEKTGLK
ncbi:MAG: CBS domain-containing protein [candidate division Zixibacteria bacterium]|nr:CBS domain-containing protein [candidate division Zixibacteria bacterium]